MERKGTLKEEGIRKVFFLFSFFCSYQLFFYDLKLFVYDLFGFGGWFFVCVFCFVCLRTRIKK